MEMKFRG